MSACLTDLIKAFQFQYSVHRASAIVSTPITSSDDILAVLDGMTKRRFFKTHLPKDLMPVQVWDKKPKVSVLNVLYMSHATYENHKPTVLHIKINIRFEVAEEGDRLTLCVSHWRRFYLP
jgi:hypothetical protein